MPYLLAPQPQMDEIDKMDDIAVYQINAGDGDGADVTFYFNGQRTAVSSFPRFPTPHNLHSDRKQPCSEDRLIGMLGHAVSAEADNDEHEEMINEILGVILDAGNTIFTEVAPLNKVVLQLPSQDLHTLLYHRTLTFRLKTAGGRAAIIPIDPTKPIPFSRQTSTVIPWVALYRSRFSSIFAQANLDLGDHCAKRRTYSQPGSGQQQENTLQGTGERIA
ncbi:hypothetical protein BJ170DRAFT_611500 [Xylariales sp. AK1849]|nr:hypothetical protein BJ170DRAFT_611500 [Xylariales sp. AK1849]